MESQPGVRPAGPSRAESIPDEPNRAELSLAGDALKRTTAGARERGFPIGLVCALLLHASALLWIIGSPPRQLGTPGGSPDAVSVELIDATDLASRETVPLPGASVPPSTGNSQPPPSPQSTPAPQELPQPPTEPAAKPEQQQQVEPQKQADEPPPKPAPDAQKAESKAAPDLRSSLPEPILEPQQPATTPDKPQKAEKAEKADTPDKSDKTDKVLADLMANPVPQEQIKPKPKAQPKSQSKPEPKPRKPSKPSQPFDLSMPTQTNNDPFAGRTAAFARPAGITRSGENDDFARGVIRALRRTMPGLDDVRGRVTVRIMLNEAGNLQEVRLVKGSGIRNMDQSVLFAVKQSSFPLPPVRSKTVDRLFLVTYIYK